MSRRHGLDAIPARYAVLLPIAAVGLVAAAVAPVSLAAVVTIVAVVAAGLACWGHDERLAWCWGFLLPIDLLSGVPTGILDAARFGGVAWLCLRFAPTLSADRRPIILRLAVGVAAVAIIRGVGSTARTDRFGMYIAGVMLIGAVVAPFVAFRVRAHATILAGFLGGALLSATVTIMQALNVPTLAGANQEGSRFPGLASTTMLITWHLAFGLIVACYFLQRGQPRPYRLVAAAFLPLGTVALVVNGAQGGLLGLGAAAGFVGIAAWRRPERRRQARSLMPYATAAVLVVAVLVVGLVASDVRTPTIDGILGEGGYRNELARFEVDRQGLETLVDHPLTGVGRTNFEDRYALAPHFLPLEAGVTSGVLGFLVGGYLLVYLLVLVLRGPEGDRPSAWLGLALAGAMWSNTLIEMGGPFTGLPRFTLLLIAVAAARGEPWPSPSEQIEAPTITVAASGGVLAALRPRRSVS